MEVRYSRRMRTLVTQMAHRGLSPNELARALISMLARSTTLQSEAGYIDARPLPPDRRTLLRRTAGPYIWVMSDKTQAEHNESAHPPIADVKADIDFCRSGPDPDIPLLGPRLEHDPFRWNSSPSNGPLIAAPSSISRRSFSGKARRLPTVLEVVSLGWSVVSADERSSRPPGVPGPRIAVVSATLLSRRIHGHAA